MKVATRRLLEEQIAVVVVVVVLQSSKKVDDMWHMPHFHAAHPLSAEVVIIDKECRCVNAKLRYTLNKQKHPNNEEVTSGE